MGSDIATSSYKYRFNIEDGVYNLLGLLSHGWHAKRRDGDPESDRSHWDRAVPPD